LDLIKIGKIVNTRGLKGELKVVVMTDFAENRFAFGKTLLIRQGKEDFSVKVESNRLFKNMLLLKLEGYDDINDVESFKGSDIFVEDEDDLALGENEFHADDIIGLLVMQNGTKKGNVKGIRELPQGDYLEITGSEGKISLVPFRDEFVIKVDLNAKIIEIVDMEGLL